MSLKYKTKGFVFKKNDRSEANQIFSFFTKDFGRIETSAKAVRKITSKLRAGVNTFYFSEIEFIQGKNNKILTDASKIKKFDNVYKNLKDFEIAQKVSYVLDSFIKGQEKDEKTFDLLIDFFEKISLDSKTTKNHQLLFNYFFWNFLSLQGYCLEVKDCAICKGKINPYNIYFSAKDGGVICKDCAGKFKDIKKINSDIVKVLRLILDKEWETVSRLKIRSVSQELLKNIYENAIYAFCPAHC